MYSAPKAMALWITPGSTVWSDQPVYIDINLFLNLLIILRLQFFGSEG